MIDANNIICPVCNNHINYTVPKSSRYSAVRCTNPNKLCNTLFIINDGEIIRMKVYIASDTYILAVFENMNYLEVHYKSKIKEVYFTSLQELKAALKKYSLYSLFQ